MRDVKVSYTVQGETVTVEGLTVGKREKSEETAVLFVSGDSSFVQWYPNGELG